MTQIHKFEAAGLGKAPFRCVGMVQRVGPIRSYINGCTVEVGAPGQPMGCCKFCGQGIKDCFIIRSADGREFDVGCDCVAKTGDAGMKKVTDKIVAGLRREQRHAREGVKLAELAALMADPNTRAVLAARPLPAGYVDR
jgi:hypothetical protein